MKAGKKVILAAVAAALVGSACVCVRHPHAVKAAVCRILPIGTVQYSGEDIKYADTFNDLNRKHLSAARSCGLDEVPETRDDIDVNSLVKIKSCKAYSVDPLSYSVPYLVEGAAGELETIGMAFRARLEENKLPDYRFIVTSVLRTKDDIKRLQKVNENSVTTSAHSYGTTFDITWARYEKVAPIGRTMKPADLKKILGEVLKEEKQKGHIFVKYEMRQKCFHITSRL